MMEGRVGRKEAREKPSNNGGTKSHMQNTHTICAMGRLD